MSQQLEEKKDKTALGSTPEVPVIGRSPLHPRSLRVFLVDDNRDHMMLVRRELEQRGHKVTSADNGEKAAALLEETAFDVAVLDYQLPDITGLELLKKIREKTEDLPIIMVTASGNEQVAVAALKAGASDYVVKESGYERELPRAVEQAVEAARASAAEDMLRMELERRARTDPLTGLLNRGEMERLIQREIQRTKRYHSYLTFALIDLDEFKAINDNCGHPTGDTVLCNIARILQNAVRSADSTARWGGDEFAVLLPDTEIGGASAFAERLRRMSKALPPSSDSKETVPLVTLSAGVVITRGGHDLGLSSLLKWADRALYAAKEEGRDRVKFIVLDESGNNTQNPEPLSASEAAGERQSDG